MTRGYDRIRRVMVRRNKHETTCIKATLVNISVTFGERLANFNFT